MLQDIPIRYGHTYKVSGWLRTQFNNDYSHGTLLTECRDYSHNPIWVDCGLNTAHEDIVQLWGWNDWTKIECEVTADNPNAKYLRLICYNSPWYPDAPPDWSGGEW